MEPSTADHMRTERPATVMMVRNTELYSAHTGTSNFVFISIVNRASFMPASTMSLRSVTWTPSTRKQSNTARTATDSGHDTLHSP